MLRTEKTVTIKKKGWWWYLPPFILSGRNRYSSTIGHTIYLTPKRWENYQTGRLSKGTEALMAHEKVHIIQQEKHGSWKWLWQYFTKVKMRRRFEVEAYAWQVVIYDGDIDYIKRRAASMASWRYFMFISDTEAFCLITADVARIKEELQNVQDTTGYMEDKG